LWLLNDKIITLLSISNVGVYGTVTVQDVFILDTQKGCYVWIGHGANPNERKNGFSYAHVSRFLIVITILGALRSVSGSLGTSWRSSSYYSWDYSPN